MSFNLVESVQKSLGFPELQKIDPNTHEVKKPEEMSAENYLGQAAIPVVLTGIYKFTRTTEGNLAILKGQLSELLLPVIFGSQTHAVIAKVAEYTGNSIDYTENKMSLIINEAIHIIRQHLGNEPVGSDITAFFTSQRPDILVYLPASLQIGKLLNDESLDDRTNKMEGPVSDIMHSIGQVFSSSGNDKKKDQNF